MLLEGEYQFILSLFFNKKIEKDRVKLALLVVFNGKIYLMVLSIKQVKCKTAQ